jgi:hypothetical protein
MDGSHALFRAGFLGGLLGRAVRLVLILFILFIDVSIRTS